MDLLTQVIIGLVSAAIGFSVAIALVATAYARKWWRLIDRCEQLKDEDDIEIVVRKRE